MIAYLVSLLGIKFPDVVMMLPLMGFIKTKLSKYKIDEVKFAFMGAIAYDFEVEPEGESLKHFGQLTPEFIMRVLKKYDEYKLQLQKSINEKKIRIENYKREMEKDLSEDEKYERENEFLDNCLLDPYKSWKVNGWYPFEIHSVYLYRLLRKKRIIPKPGKKDQGRIWDLAVHQLTKKMSFDGQNKNQRAVFEKIKKILKDGGKDLENLNEVQYLARAIAFREWITGQKKKKVDLNKYF